MTSPTIQFKRGLFVNLPSLRAGEPGFTTDKSDLYIGSADGNKFFGSNRYWEKENGTNALKFKLVDKDGSNSIGLRAPATLANSNTVYTLPSAPTDGYFLKTNASGELEWASVTAGASFESVTINNSTFTGVSTFSGLIEADAGIDVTGHTELDSLNVSGVGTIATVDINAGNIDGTVIGSSSAAAGTFTQLNYSNSSTSGISTVGSLYVGADKVLSVESGDLTLSNIDAIDEVTRLTLESALSLNPNDFDSLNVTGISTIGGLLDANGGLDVLGHSELDSLNVSGVSTFVGVTTFQSAVYVASELYVGGITINGSNGTSSFGEDIVTRNINASGIVTATGLLDANGGLDVLGHSELDSLNVSGVSTFTGAINANGGVVGNLTGNADTATALATSRDFEITGSFVTATAVSFDGSGNVSLAATITANSIELGTYTSGDYVATVSGTANEITVSGTGEGAAVVVGLPDDVVVGTSLSAPTIKTAAVKHSNGTDAITIDSIGNVGVATDLTVNGNLNVLGSTTTVNTETLLVKDPLIEVGLVDDNGNLVAPSSDSNLDVGLVFHYYNTAAKKAAVYWDDSEGKLAFASEVSEANGVLTATTYATILAGGLEINNECTGGTDTVISCVGGELALSNIVLDGGSF